MRADKVYQPSATCSQEGGRKITKPSTLGCAHLNQVSNFGRAPSSISSATLGARPLISVKQLWARTLFNQQSNFGRAPSSIS